MTPTNSVRSPRPRVASSTVELDPDSVVGVAGPADENLRVLEHAFEADILTRGNRVTIRGEASEVSQARRVLQEMINLVERGHVVDPAATKRAITLVEKQAPALVSSGDMAPIVSYRGKAVRPKTPGQRELSLIHI